MLHVGPVPSLNDVMNMFACLCRYQQTSECSHMSSVQSTLHRHVVRWWNSQDMGPANWRISAKPRRSGQRRQWWRRVAHSLQQQ